jgi:hypothetical protein
VTAREEVRRQVTVVGRVVLGGSGGPAAGAIVTVREGPETFFRRVAMLAAVWGSGWNDRVEREDRTWAAVDGLFWFLDLPDGTYRLSAVKPLLGRRYGAAQGQVTVRRDERGRVQLEPVVMELPATGVAGRVLDAATLYGARVAAEQGLVSRWRLGETDAELRDDLGGRHAVPIGAVTLGAASLLVHGEDAAVEFSGSGYLEVGYAAALNPAVLSLEVWAQPTGPSEGQGVVTSRDHGQAAQFRGYQLGVSSSGQWEFRVGDGSTWSVAVGASVEPGRAAHVVGTFDGAMARVYVDGVLSGTGPVGAVLAPNTGRPLRIGAGRTETVAGSFFEGVIDEVAVYGRALPPEVVEAHHGLGTSASAGTGIGMASVHVDGSGEQIHSDNEGSYHLAGLEPGQRRLRFSAAGYRPESRITDLLPSEQLDLTVLLSR